MSSKANPGASTSPRGPARPNPNLTDPAREPMRRRIYAQQRIPELVAELKRLANEKQQLAEKRKVKEIADSERKKLNQRWMYVMLRNEALRAERKQLGDQLKSK